MDIDTSAAIKAFFPSSSLLLVFYEAIANALDANATSISLNIEIESFDKPDTLKVVLEDNGDGFNPESFDRFIKLLRPKDTYHKGVGRLVYLNYFKYIDITSSWGMDGRNFRFSEDFDKSSTEFKNGESIRKTTLSFNGFKNQKINSYNDLKPSSLSEKIIEHFLPTFISMVSKEIDFEIKVSLITSEHNSSKGFYSDNKVVNKSNLPKMDHEKLELFGKDSINGVETDYIVGDLCTRGEFSVKIRDNTASQK
jgi:hypothetical protein